HMSVVLHVDSKEPFPGWEGYEWVRGRADVTVDPEHPANARIVDLDLVARDPAGLVTFESDVRLLRPVGGGNGRLLSVVPNRGMTGGVPLSLDAQGEFGVIAEPPRPGDGFLLAQGWTVLWTGWQWDVLEG